MKVTLYSKDGLTPKAELHKLTYNGTFLGECFVSAKFESPTPIDFEIGDYFHFRNEKFVLNYIPPKQKKARKGTYGAAFVYDNIKFNSLSDELTRVEFLDVVLFDNKIHYTSLSEFSFYANSVQDLADRLQANLDRVYSGDEKWTVIVSPDSVTSDKNITINKISCWEALGLANSEFGANFIIRNRTITIGTAGIAVGKVFGYGKGKGLYDIQQTTNQDAQIITRLRAYGSTRNIPHKYYNKLKDGSGKQYIKDSVYIPNLMLPEFPIVISDPSKVYLDSNTIAEYGLREGSIYFDGSDKELPDIFPSLEGMTQTELNNAGISVSLKYGDNGNIDEVLSAENPTDSGEIPQKGEGEIPESFTIYLKDLGFDIAAKDSDGQYKYATTDTMQIAMKSGMCVGRTFDILERGITKDTSLGYTRYVVRCKRFTDDAIGGGVAFPNNNYQIHAADKFVILGIEMPDVYIKAAAQRLKVAAEEYLSENDKTKFTYTPKIDEIFMANNPELGESIKEGDILNFDDTDLNIDASVIIQSLKINIGTKLIPTYDVTLSNEQVAGTLDKIQNSINQLITNNTGVTLEQVKSLILSLGTHYFLSRLKDDDAEGNLRFIQSLSIEKDLTVHKDITSKGQVISNQFGNDTFTSGQFGSGFRIWKDANNGQSYAELDNLFVRRETTFSTLSVAEIKSVGGQILVSPASMVCSKVEIQTDGYKCFFETDNGKILNQFVINDQAICRKFNGQDMKYYWRRVLAVGSDYIVLSKTDADGSDIPTKGDDIIQFGNRTDAKRQSAIIISSYGSDAPSIKQYAGINSFNLTGKEVTVISPSGNKFKGNFIIESTGKSVESELKVLSDSVSSKVSQTDFNSLQGRVSTTESKIEQQAGQISSTITKVEGKNSVYKSYTSAATDRPTVPYAKGDLWVTYDGTIKQSQNTRTSGAFVDSDWKITTKYTDDTKANAAQTAANNAQTSANTANTKLSEIANDNLLTPSEKQEALKEWNIIKGEYSTVVAQANTYGVATTTYVNAYNALNSYITPLLTNLTINSTIAGTTFRNNFKVYYDAKIALLKGVTDKAKALVDTAQTVANNAQASANSKNRTYYSDTTPAVPEGGHRVGDLWYKISLTDGCYLTYRWNGSTWQQINVYVSKSRIEQTDSRITSVVEKTGVNSLGNGETLYSKINQTASDIRLEVSKIQVGGRNYALKTSKDWSNMVTLTNTINQCLFGHTVNAENWQAGDVITVSFDYKFQNIVKNANPYLTFQGSGNVTGWTAGFTSHSIVSRVSGTGEIKVAYSFTLSAQQATNATFSINMRHDNMTGSVAIKNLMIEKSTKPSDWQPAPEDIGQIAGSSLTLTDNKISLGAKTIELNGHTIAKAIEAQNLSVKTADGTSVFEVQNNGRFYSKSVADGQSLEIDSQNRKIEFQNSQTIYTETNGLKTVTQTTKIDASNGVFESRDSDYNTAYMSSQGILANRAGVSPYSATTGYNIKASIAGLGFGAMNKSYFNNWGLVGVFGRASNSASNPAPAYGGWFDILKANGLCFGVRRISATTTLNQGDTYVSCYNSTSDINLFLPANPYEGTCILIRRVNAKNIHIYGNGKQIHTDGNIVNDLWHRNGRGDTSVVIFDGQYWMFNYWPR
ncbi:hypothetical protein [Dysgonomonas sp. 25]|uniref:hypothetical protein n=1 Tax=Dysgonomonas sp. 25 TaxID=2302933 RepID=UPI0013D70DCB|nr:hypothetical protein [Dysgonomonas sp. 25]NDV68584.1 hypothetical protein [Dysgonomonas sp. 25]